MVGPSSRQLRAARPLRFAVEIGFGDCVEIRFGAISTDSFSQAVGFSYKVEATLNHIHDEEPGSRETDKFHSR